MPVPFRVCKRCGFLAICGQAAVSAKQVAAHYESVDPHRKVAGSKQSFFNRALAVMEKPAGRNLSLLDVGCGYGYFLQQASARGWRVAGVEIARDAADAAGKALGGKNIHHGTLASALLPDCAFDAITLWDVLVFAPDPERELRECFRILKNGGTIGLRVRNVTFQKWLHRFYSPIRPVFVKCGFRNPYVFHPRNFSQMALRALLDRIGFTGIRICNSPLTRGDPYGTAKPAGLVSVFKSTVAGLSNAAYYLSGGRWTLGPSLLAWAVKPAVRKSARD